MLRVGIGFDAHCFEKGREMIIGGVNIPFELGLAGHSDADVLVHAIMDAMLGALSLGDIGGFFPDTDIAYEGISSLVLLEKVNMLIQSKGYNIGNIDTVIIAEFPKMKPYIDDMKQCVALKLGISADMIGIKATTTEKMGFTGRKRGNCCASGLFAPEQELFTSYCPDDIIVYHPEIGQTNARRRADAKDTP